MMEYLLVVLLILVNSAFVRSKTPLVQYGGVPVTAATCEAITVPMCRNMPYNLTRMPNQFNHENQQEAALEVHQFWALVEINCSKDLRFFLCSMYTPICIENYPQPVRACKSVCERARNGCEKYMKKFGFDWPEHMNCNLYPEYGSVSEVCMDPMDAEIEAAKKKKEQAMRKPVIKPEKDEINIFSMETAKVAPFANTDLDKICLSPLIKITDYRDSRYNRISTGNVLNCARPCHDQYFTESENSFSYYWILFWSVLCFISTCSTTLTYMIDTSRFKYPEKPIIYLSICYFFVSLGFLTKYLMGNERIACELDGSLKHAITSSRHTTGTSTILCTITFMLIYYFSMASAVWWVIISFTWFLAAGLKWGIESISKYSYYFHLIAWLLPAIKSILILSIGYVDADSLSGVCFVGNTNLKSLKIFIIIPIFIYLSIGISFLLLGFISLFRLRNLIKQQQGHAKTTKLEKLMLRIGIFSILYTIPATCLISCYFYEQYYRIEWEQNYLCSRQVFADGADTASLNLDMCLNTRRPEFMIFMLKYFSLLIIGVTSGFWIWTFKTLNSWKGFFIRNFFCNSKKRISNKTKNKDSAVIYFQAAAATDNNNNTNDNNTQTQVRVYQFNDNNNNRQDAEVATTEVNYCNIGSTVAGSGIISAFDSSQNTNKTTATTKLQTTTASSLSSDSTISTSQTNSYTLMSSSNYNQFPTISQYCQNANRIAAAANLNAFYGSDDSEDIVMVPPPMKFPVYRK